MSKRRSGAFPGRADPGARSQPREGTCNTLPHHCMHRPASRRVGLAPQALPTHLAGDVRYALGCFGGVANTPTNQQCYSVESGRVISGNVQPSLAAGWLPCCEGTLLCCAAPLPNHPSPRGPSNSNTQGSSSAMKPKPASSPLLQAFAGIRGPAFRGGRRAQQDVALPCA